jgi:PQQ-like domain
MRRPLMSIVMLAFSAVTAFAQASSVEEKFPNQVRRTAALQDLHDVLRNHSNLHDAHLAIAAIGNEESVPLLLERLRLDYGSLQHGDPSGVGVGFDCAQVHLVDALRTITNTDQGMYYPLWLSWWEANRGLPQKRWIQDGFAVKGLHVVEPVDEQFGLELIELIGQDRGYLNFNAKRLLRDAAPEQRAKWAARAAESDQRYSQLGAIQVLRLFEIDGQDALLRRLTDNSDLELRRQALTRLNDHLRTSLSAAPGNARIVREADKDNWITGVGFIGDLLIAVRNSEVEAFDTRTLGKLWTRRVFSRAGGRVLVVRNRMFLGAQEGIIAIDQRGKVVWRREAYDEVNQMRRLISRGDEIVLVRLNSLDQLDINTGAVKSTIPSDGTIRDADSTSKSGFFVDGRGLRYFGDAAGPEYRLSHAIGVSVNEQSVCVTSADDRITCLAPVTLAVQWTRPIGANGTWGHDVAPIQYGSQVFVSTDNELTAFDASDGFMRWTASGGQESHGITAPTDYGLLVPSNTYKLELRDLQTGEVRRVWPQIPGVERVAVLRQFAAVVDFKGGLWLIDLRN